MWRSLGLAAVVIGLVSGVIWWTRAGAERSEGANSFDGVTAQVDRPPEKARLLSGNTPPAPNGTPNSGRALYDPLVIGPCNVVPSQEQEVSSQVEGTLQEVRANLGRQVARGEMLARLDERLLRPQVEMLQIKASSEAARLIARAQLEDIDAKLVVAVKLLAKRAYAAAEVEAFQFQRQRYAEELRKAEEDQEVARKELEKARRSLDMHQIRSDLAGEVTKVYKRAGESIKPAEPLFWVANCDRLRIEGLCKVQQAGLLRVGMRAIVEPEVRGEQMTELSGHTAAVTSLAVSADGRLLASASEDRTVLLWNWPQGTRRALLPHPAEVFAVAVAPGAGGGYRVLTGCADGRARLWIVHAAGTIDGPMSLAEGHEGAVRAVAFSPDGRWCATGAEDKRIGVWDSVAGTRRCWLRAEADGGEFAHRGAVTAVQFTHDGRLISAGRDNTLKVWKLGEAGGELVATHAGRTGDAPQLGVAPDGKRLLFDHGEELRLLDREHGNSLGALRSRRQGRFHGFALFSPSGRLVLSAANNGRLQLWTVPAAPEAVAFFRQGYGHGFRRDAVVKLGGLLSPTALVPVPTRQLWRLDGHEVRHFFNPTPAAVICGAFAPDETVAFTAGADKVIRVWGVPPASHGDELLEAEVTYVGSQVERGTDLVRVRAELDNPTDAARRLRPGTFAHLRVYPEMAR